MKILLIASCALTVICSPRVEAGVNGTYKVSGTETENGKKYKFTGTVKISKYKVGTYDLKFKDGERTAFVFNFTKPLKDITKVQTVTGKSSLGTGTASFRYTGGHYKVEFTYKAKSADIKGTGSGTK